MRAIDHFRRNPRPEAGAKGRPVRSTNAHSPRLCRGVEQQSIRLPGNPPAEPGAIGWINGRLARGLARVSTQLAQPGVNSPAAFGDLLGACREAESHVTAGAGAKVVASHDSHVRLFKQRVGECDR